MRRPRPLLRALAQLLAPLLLALPAAAQWAPASGSWGKVVPTDVRVMTWNVQDALCRTNPKTEGNNNWSACARIVAGLAPDVLLLQECGDNAGNGTGSGVDSVAQLTTVLQLFVNGGNDPYLGGAVTAYVQKYAPGLTYPFVFVSQTSDGFNRNVILSRYPFADLNGDGVATLSNIPNVTAHLYAPGGNGGVRGFQFAELDLPSGVYAGDLVVANAHLKAGGTNSDEQERNVAARNVAYYVDHLLNGAGLGVPDPFGRIADSPQAQAILAPGTAVVLGGDWNEDEVTNGQKGPADWLTRADVTGCCDGTDRDRTDMTLDTAVHFFTGSRNTQGSSKLDYLAWQDSITSPRLSVVFSTSGTPGGALPPELSGFPSPGSASTVASDHRPVLVDFVLPLAPPPCVDPVRYCIAAPNSAGPGAHMQWLGVPSLSVNAFDLLVEGAVPNQFGIFYYGANAVQQPFGNGWRCVGGGALGIFRLLPPQLADAFGDVLRRFDFTQAPAAAGAGEIQAGATWRFQYWYRDPAGGGTGFNLSDGLEVLFCPWAAAWEGAMPGSATLAEAGTGGGGPHAFPVSAPRAAALRVGYATFPLLLLPILGAVLGVSLLRPFADHHALLLPALWVAGLAWLCAVGIARGGGADLRIVVTGAIALRLLALGGAPELSDDVYRYAWEGELVAAGVSPYAYSPDAPELEGLRAARPELYGLLNHPDVSAAYPPVAQAVFAGLRRLCDALGFEGWRPAVFALRSFFGLCDLLVLVPLVALLRRRGLPDGMAVVWGWSPLVSLEFAGSGHFDSLGILLLVSVLAVHAAAAARRLVPSLREAVALALLAAATLVKLLPVCAAPFLARGRAAWLRLALFGALVALGFLPVVAGLEGGAQGLGSGLSEYGLRWEHSGLVYGGLEDLLRRAGLGNDLSWLDARRVGRGLVVAVWLAIGVGLWLRRTRAVEATSALIAAFLVLSPTLHPWYLAWLVPFLALRPRPSFLWLTAAAVALYWAPVLQALEGRYEVPPPQRLLMVVPFWVLLLFELRSKWAAGRRRSGPALPSRP